MLSAAAVNRRERSSRLSRKAMNRRLIPARSFTPSAYAKTFNIGNVILLQTLSLLIEQLRRTPAERARIAESASIAIAKVRGAARKRR
jgi:hypothetical protein